MKVYPRHQQQYQSLFHVNGTTAGVRLHAGPDGQRSVRKARHTWRTSACSLRLQQPVDPSDRRGPRQVKQSRFSNSLRSPTSDSHPGSDPSHCRWAVDRLRHKLSASAITPLETDTGSHESFMGNREFPDEREGERTGLSWISSGASSASLLAVVGLSTFVFLFPFACHMGAVSLPAALPLYYKPVCLQRLQAT